MRFISTNKELLLCIRFFFLLCLAVIGVKVDGFAEPAGLSDLNLRLLEIESGPVERTSAPSVGILGDLDQLISADAAKNLDSRYQDICQRILIRCLLNEEEAKCRFSDIYGPLVTCSLCGNNNFSRSAVADTIRSLKDEKIPGAIEGIASPILEFLNRNLLSEILEEPNLAQLPISLESKAGDSAVHEVTKQYSHLNTALKNAVVLVTRLFSLNRSPTQLLGKGFKQDEPRYWRLVRDYILSIGTDEERILAEQVSEIEWGAWCGTGSENFWRIRNLINYRAAIKGGDYPKALGALYGLSWATGSRRYYRELITLARKVNIEPERIVAGAILQGYARLSDLLSLNTDLANELSIEVSSAFLDERQRFGDRSAIITDLGNSLARGNGEKREHYSRFTNRFPNLSCDNPKTDGPDTQDLPKISNPATIARLNSIFLAFADVKYGFQVTRAFLDAVQDSGLEVGREVLDRLAQTIDEKTRQKAVKLLRMKTPGIELKPIQPVSFKFMQNGKSLSNASIKVTCKTAQNRFSQCIVWSMVSNVTDGEGIIQFRPEQLYDPSEQIEALEFLIPITVDGNEFSVARTFSLPQFDPNKTIFTIAIETGEMKVSVDEESHKVATINLEFKSNSLPVGNIPVRLTENEQISGIPAGKYRLGASCIGCAAQVSKEVEIISGKVTNFEISLKKGSDAKIRVPLETGGATASTVGRQVDPAMRYWFTQTNLLKPQVTTIGSWDGWVYDGLPKFTMDDSGNLKLEGLGQGKYSLRFCYDECLNRVRDKLFGCPCNQEKLDRSGRYIEREITVDSSTPDEIELKSLSLEELQNYYCD